MGFDIIDGELWDEETGEYAGPASGWIKGNESPEDLALLVMRKRMDTEASIQAEKDKLDAITNNMVKMIGKHVARLEWLDARYNAQLQDYAMSQLPEPIKSAMLEHPADALKAGFIVHPEAQAVTIKTV